MPDSGISPIARMTVVPGIDALTGDLGRLFVVVGVFDGLHLGHAYLLEHLLVEAHRRSARPAVITFDHHPDEILTGAAPPLLCDPDERLARLEAAGVEVTVVQHFDLALRMTRFDDFIRRVGAEAPLAGFLMTPDSAFGHERGGTVETVGELGRAMGFEVAVVPNLEVGGQPVRSSDIRKAIAAGDLPAACRLLGRPYAVVGRRSGSLNGRRTRVRFPMPVALPPVGDYPIWIEPPLGQLGPGPGGPAAASLALAGEGRATVVGAAGLSGPAYRLVFACEQIDA
jgi:riboflavin kinase/FMN adenylyltransferase